MTLVLPKAMRIQIEAADAWCRELGLEPGVFSWGGKHGRYTVALRNGRDMALTIACTPRDMDDAIKHLRRHFRHEFVRLMGAAA